LRLFPDSYSGMSAARHSGGVAEFSFISEAVWPEVVAARERGDAAGEAVALAALSQALFEEGHHDEADLVVPYLARLSRRPESIDGVRSARVELLTARGARLEQEAEALPPAPSGRAHDDSSTGRRRYRLLTSAGNAYFRVYKDLSDLGDGYQDAAQEAYARLRITEFHRDGEWAAAVFPSRPPISTRATDLFVGLVQGWHIKVHTGFAAAAVGGPQLIEFGQWLGDRLRESTARALGRIHLRTGFIRGHHELVVDLSGALVGGRTSQGWLFRDRTSDTWQLGLPDTLREKLPSSLVLRVPQPEHDSGSPTPSTTDSLMAEFVSNLDVVWRQVEEARCRDDRSAEAVALALAGHALFACDRSDEGDLVVRDAAELARRHNTFAEIRRAQAAALQDRAGELEKIEDRSPASRSERRHEPSAAARRRNAALRVAGQAYHLCYLTYVDLGDAAAAEQAYVKREMVLWRGGASARPLFQAMYGWDTVERAETAAMALELGPSEVETVVAGFFALKVVGPFLEEFAKKIGQQFGETTLHALRRIRLRSRDKRSQELEVCSITLVLPPQLSEEAERGILEIDLTDPAYHGAILHWDPDSKIWRDESSSLPPDRTERDK
jgi:hypothetical protein